MSACQSPTPAGTPVDSQKSVAAPAPALAPVPAMAPAAVALPSGDLGGGYRELKWGSPMAQAEALYGTPIKRGADPAHADRQFLSFLLKDSASGQPTRKELVTYFLGGECFRAMLVPHFSENNTAGYNQLRMALEQKFGPGRKVTTETDPAEVIAWDDGKTRIEFGVEVLSLEVAAARNLVDRRRFDTVSVLYSSLIHLKKLEVAAPAAAPTAAAQ